MEKAASTDTFPKVVPESLLDVPDSINGSAPGARFPFTRTCGVGADGKSHRVLTKQRHCVSTLRTCGDDYSDG